MELVIRKNKLKYILTIFAIIFIAYSATIESYEVSLIGVLLLVAIILNGTAIEDFYIFLSLIPFTTYLVNISNITQYLFLGILMLSIIKLLVGYTKFRLQISIILCSTFLIFIEIFNDILLAKHMHSVPIVIYILYFCIFIMKINLEKYNHTYALKHLISGLMIALLTISFGFEQKIGDLLYVENAIRLGEESNLSRLLGGAMAIPIYSLLIISLLITYMILNRTNKFEKIIFNACIIFSFIVGFLTVSRLYLVGLIVFFLLLALAIFSKKGYKIFALFSLAGLVGIGVIYSNPIIIENTLMKFSQRSLNGFLTDIRTQIYLSIFNYLKNNPEFIFLGKGAINYVFVGVNEGLLFGMMAHNLLLDGLISFGIVGLISLIAIIIFYVKKCRYFSSIEASFLTIIPFITLIAMYMTQGSFNYFEVYIYILFLILNIFYCVKPTKED